LNLGFGEFFVQPVGSRGLAFSDALRAADGRRIHLVGYMASQEQPAPERFLLTPRPMRLSEHADGHADDLPPATVLVLLDPGQRNRVVVHQAGAIALGAQHCLRPLGHDGVTQGRYGRRSGLSPGPIRMLIGTVMPQITASWIERFATRLIELQPQTRPLDAVRNATAAYPWVAGQLTPEDAAHVSVAGEFPSLLPNPQVVTVRSPGGAGRISHADG